MYLKLRILFTWLAVACAVACFFVGTFVGLPAAILCIIVGASFAGLMYLCKQKQEAEDAKKQQTEAQKQLQEQSQEQPKTENDSTESDKETADKN